MAKKIEIEKPSKKVATFKLREDSVEKLKNYYEKEKKAGKNVTKSSIIDYLIHNKLS